MAPWGGPGGPPLSLAASTWLGGKPVIAANVTLAKSPKVLVVIDVSFVDGFDGKTGGAVPALDNNEQARSTVFSSYACVPFRCTRAWPGS
jgi:hypothetical protein